MNWLDWLIMLIIFLGAVGGIKRGLLLSLFGLGGLIAAVGMGWHYSPDLAAYFEENWYWQSRLADYFEEITTLPDRVAATLAVDTGYAGLAESILNIGSFFAIFVVTLVVVRSFGRVLSAVVGWGFTGVADRIMGGVLGFFTATLSVSVALGVILATSASLPALAVVAEAIYDSSLGPDLVGIFYALSPLGEQLTDWLLQ